MSAFSQIANQLLLPPGLLVLLLTAALIAVLRRRAAGTLPRLLLAAALLLTYALSLDPVSSLLITPLESAYPYRPPSSFSAAGPAADEWSATAEHPGAIVVLGSGIAAIPSPAGGDGPSKETEEGTSARSLLSSVSLSRHLHAYRIQRRTGLPVITAGGPPEGMEEPAEAAVGARLLRELGVPPQKITAETESRSTYENACNTAALTDCRSIILVTSAAHMPRSVRTFRSTGFNVTPAPTDYLGEHGGASLWKLLPSMEALERSYAALHEYAGRAWYAVAY